MKLKDSEYWDKPYKCHTCGIRFENIQDQQHHLTEHLPRGICLLCKEFKIVEDHHYSYKDYNKNKKLNTIKLCHSCHGYQTIIKHLIREGLQLIYIPYENMVMFVDEFLKRLKV